MVIVGFTDESFLDKEVPLDLLVLDHSFSGKPVVVSHCPPRGMGEEPSPLGEEFRLGFA
jgi:hypothetical protein